VQVTIRVPVPVPYQVPVATVPICAYIKRQEFVSTKSFLFLHNRPSPEDASETVSDDEAAARILNVLLLYRTSAAGGGILRVSFAAKASFQTSVGDADPELDPDPHVFRLPDPDPLFRITYRYSDPDPDPSLFLINVLSGHK
jgi:hypothetical protein